MNNLCFVAICCNLPFELNIVKFYYYIFAYFKTVLICNNIMHIRE